jgi:hypothetical protein
LRIGAHLGEETKKRLLSAVPMTEIIQ